MKKIIILTLFSFFSAMGGDFGLVPYVPNTISPRQLDYRTNGNDVDMNGTAGFVPLSPDLMSPYWSYDSETGALLSEEYQDFGMMTPLVKRAYTPLQDDDTADTFAIPSPSLILDQESQSVLATQNTKDSDNESSSAKSSKKKVS